MRISAEKQAREIHQIKKTESLDKAEHLIETLGNPQTYIVDLKGNLFIGGHVQEHVYVARGEKVLTAGEAIFKKKEGYNNISILQL